MALETEYVDWLRQNLPSAAGIKLGLGDDAAILGNLDNDIVVTTDLLCDGVHFLAQQTPAEQIGYKALAVNLSDLAAMAAQPLAAFVSLLLPRSGDLEMPRRLTLGMRTLAERFDVSLAGGDTNSWPGQLVVNVALIGRTTPTGPLLRSGARPGDVLVVTGTLGGSILGHHLKFTPRVDEALALAANYQLGAGMDLSDGLALDLRRLTQESGCGAVLEAAAIPISNSARQMAGPQSALEHALGDGEDFELLLALRPAEAKRLLHEQPLDVPITAVGECTKEPSLWLRQPDGSRTPLPDIGFQHALGHSRPRNHG